MCPREVDLTNEGTLRVTFAIPFALSHIFDDRSQSVNNSMQHSGDALWPSAASLGTSGRRKALPTAYR